MKQNNSFDSQFERYQSGDGFRALSPLVGNSDLLQVSYILSPAFCKARERPREGRFLQLFSQVLWLLRGR